jgi:hypothetical protein
VKVDVFLVVVAVFWAIGGSPSWVVCGMTSG